MNGVADGLADRAADFAQQSPAAVCETLGERLKQARLNQDLTQTDVAEQAGVSRKAVLNAEKGKVQLEVLVAILQALRLTAQLDQFLPPAPVSPLQLAKLQGKRRQRASGSRKESDNDPMSGEDDSW
ncbi:MAG: transcriptional regulator [Oceanospirillaceae bacterium]|nr:transcriptional regulator [Oceanospirillaceae bacterium]MBT13095.1 transcriptional regulator [Oceanospirillaceae bacterium]|tara:strand:+ start:1657 stop:2037 length:381 start_codon:yes stop_codon:yes gene_type:complete